MEHPLRPLPRHDTELHGLAQALLYSDQSREAHVTVLRAAFLQAPPLHRLNLLAARTVIWTSMRPQPRLKALVQELRWDSILSKILERYPLKPSMFVLPDARMRPIEGGGSLPGLNTVSDLAAWLRLDPEHLLWFADLRDRNRKDRSSLLSHYTTRILIKRDNTVRLLEIPKQHLKSIQRQILDEILTQIPLHPAVHGFRKGHSILSFAAPHAAREAVLRLDLQDFFPSITGSRVQALFRTIGYPEPVADLLGGLCTIAAGSAVWRNTGCELSPETLQQARSLYSHPHLPQGAPTSPAIANLCAFRLDRRIAGLAKRAGATYTRYADDLAFSGDARFARGANRFVRHLMAIVAEEGFAVHPRKSRLMLPAVRQHLAGLTLNVRPSLPRRELDLLEAILTNCVRYGPESQNREAHPEFRRHLEGRVAFAEMVNPLRAIHHRALFSQIAWLN